MAQLSPDTVLRRLPELSVRLHANDEITVSAGDRSITCGSHGLLVLDAFSRPRSFAEAVAALAERVTGAQDWVDLTATIRALHETGFLEEEGSTATSVPAMPYGFDDPAAHVSMLNDRSRTSASGASVGCHGPGRPATCAGARALHARQSQSGSKTGSLTPCLCLLPHHR